MRPDGKTLHADGRASGPSICFLMPYFGKWPWWMPFFVESCRANPDIDWLFFSDCGEIPLCPPNVRVMRMTFVDYCSRVADTLEVPFSPKNPYKLCDVRPAFGCIHEEELKGYDFWAFGDIDLVLGDLRAHYTPERLEGKDLLSTHARRVSGHCTLIRNNARMRDAFRQIPQWKQRFCDDAHQALDEGAFSRIFVRHKNWPSPLFKLAAHFNPWWRRSEFVEAFSTPGAKVDWLDGGRDFPRRWYWREGVLTNDRDGVRTFPYFHFIVWKKNDWAELGALPLSDPEVLHQLAASGQWEMNATGFHPLR